MAASDDSDDGPTEGTWAERHARAQRPAPGVSDLLGIGAAFGVCVGAGILLGVVLDHVTGSSPLFALLGTAVGIVIGAFGSYQIIKPYVKG